MTTHLADSTEKGKSPEPHRRGEYHAEVFRTQKQQRSSAGTIVEQTAMSVRGLSMISDNHRVAPRREGAYLAD